MEIMPARQAQLQHRMRVVVLLIPIFEDTLRLRTIHQVPPVLHSQDLHSKTEPPMACRPSM